MPSPAVNAVQHVSNILAIRAFPFAVYGAVAPALSVRARLLVATCYIGGLVLLRADVAGIVGPTVLGSAYYLLLASTVPKCAEALRARRITRGALFVAFAASYLLLPAVLVPQIAPATFLVLGWDLLLSSYSYCVDVSSSRHAPRMTDCLFFLLVNPTLTYSNRGLRFGPPAFQWRGLARVVLGVTSMLFCAAILRPAYRAMPQAGEPLRSMADLTGSLILAGSLRLIIEYAAHSGLASIQIGFMRLIGYSIPERYNFPLLATSPLDFWRRWNTYVGSWLGKYVFMPLTRQLQSGLGVWSKAAALLLTFIVSGILHDGFTYATKLAFHTKNLQLFAASGLAVLLWLALERILLVAGLSARRLIQAIARPLPRLATLLLLIGAAARWG